MLGPSHSGSLKLFQFACVSATALALCGCGGGGGGVAYIPPPPATPTPPPPPTPGSSSISAPARASVGAGAAAPVFAGQNGPNFTSGAPGTIFPVLQTAMTYGDRRAGPDDTVNAAGGTANLSDSVLSITIAGTQVPKFAAANLDWTRAGWWGEGPYPGSRFPDRGAFVTGFETPAAAVPMTGTATYRGAVSGFVIGPLPPNTLGGFACACTEINLEGMATFSADFGARTVNGNLSDMRAGAYDDPWEGSYAGERWNDVVFNSVITSNAFSGTTQVTSAPSGLYSMSGGATGTIEGKFFGPSAQEAGAVWTLFDGTRAAIGTLSGKRP
jgi:hypothetical protein